MHGKNPCVSSKIINYGEKELITKHGNNRTWAQISICSNSKA